MKVALIADTFSVREGTGIARYSRELLEGLRGKGLQVEPIAPPVPSVPFGLAVNHALKMPHLVLRSARRFDLIHATSPITALAFPLLGKPRVVTYHDLVSLLGENPDTAPHARLAAPLFLRVGHFADRVIADSSQTQKDIVTHLGISAQKITVVGLGVRQTFRPRPARKRPGYVIGYIGTLNPRKSLSYLLKAFRILRTQYPHIPAQLVIYGKRTVEFHKLTRLSQELGLSDVVEFRGPIADDDLVDAYNSFDVFVLPSEREGFGLPILEAHRCGVPVVIRQDARIPPEVSKHCVKSDSVEDGAERIFELLTNSTLRRTVVEQALDYCQQFTWERTVQRTIELYDQVLGGT